MQAERQHPGKPAVSVGNKKPEPVKTSSAKTAMGFRLHFNFRQTELDYEKVMEQENTKVETTCGLDKRSFDLRRAKGNAN